MKKTIRIKEIIIILVSILLFLQIYLQEIIAPLKFLDEIISVTFLIYFLVNTLLKRKKISVINVKILGLLFSVIIIGVISNIISKVQTTPMPILIDIGNCIKVFLIFMGSSLYMQSLHQKNKIIQTLAKFMRCFVAITFICGVLHLFVDIGMGSDVRFGIRSFQFINNGAGQFSLMFYNIIFILTLDLRYERKKRLYKNIFIIIACVTWCLTLRARAFIFVLIYLFLYWKFLVHKKAFRLNLASVTIIVGIIVVLGAKQFFTYFNNTRTARFLLLLYGINTMKRYFPLGSGFATFGTDAAVTYYSKLYLKYGFNNVWGLSKEHPMFASDNYWPAVLAQFGAIGTVAMIMIIYYIFKEIAYKSRYDIYGRLACIFISITQLVASIATAVFFNFTTVGLFFLIPLAFGESVDKKKETGYEKSSIN